MIEPFRANGGRRGPGGYFDFSSGLVVGVAVGAGAFVGAAPAAGLGAPAGVEAGGGSSGLQPTTMIIANTALVSSDKALIPILAITDELLDVKHVTSRVVTLDFRLAQITRPQCCSGGPACPRPISDPDYRGK